jgi:hypothetical protein
MVKNLGGGWEFGRKLVDGFCAGVPGSGPDFSVRWGAGISGGTTLVFDLGWFNRGWDSYKKQEGGYYQVGLNCLNWLPAVARDSRPVNGDATRVLVLGQVAFDAQHGLSRGELNKWISERRVAGAQMRYRPHPQGLELPPERSLDEDLEWCDHVLTYNSTAGLEALRRGIPVTSSTNCFYRDLCNGPCPDVATRERFFRRVAWAQWTEQEIVDGTVYREYLVYL